MAKTKKTAKKPAAKKPAVKTKSKAAAARKAARPVTHAMQRGDFGKPIDSFFNKQPEPQRSILTELRKLVEAAAPDASSAIKWGMPTFQINGKMFVTLGSHKSHVNLIMWGPAGAHHDPDKRLSSGKMGSHIKLTTLDELPRDQIRGWLQTSAQLVRAK
jgi:hypothetical protein